MTEEEEVYNNSLNVLNSVQEHIRLLDNKAVGLLTAIGIVFSFSLFSIDNLMAKEGISRTMVFVFGSLYLLCFLISILLLIVSLFPMRKKRDGKYYSRYAIDVYRVSKSDRFLEAISKKPAQFDIMDQVRICSKIAHCKENCLRLSCFFIAASVVLLLVLITIVILG